MKRATNRLAAVFGLCLIITAFAAGASAGDADYQYSESDGKITITRYTGSGGAVDIPAEINGKTVANIGNYAFYNCTNLTSVMVPNSVVTIGTNAFSGCSSLTNVAFGNSVASIGFYAFYNCIGLTSVTVPNSVTTIGYGAFSFCENLASVTIGSGVTSIGDTAFMKCTGLESVIIPDSVTTIGLGAFARCDSLSSVTIGSGVTSIGSAAFSSCGSLTSVTIPDSVTSLGYRAFWSSTGLTSVVIGNGVTNIENETFMECIGLKSVTFGNNLTSIGEEAFYICTSLENVIIPDSVISIGIYAFASCGALTSVLIPSNVTSIGYGAFVGCARLTSIDVSAGNLRYISSDGVLFDINQAALVQYPGGKYGPYAVPSGVTGIGACAFSGCAGLTSVDIPDSVMRIEMAAFAGCSLNNAIIGSGVTYLGTWMFYGCSNLTGVYFKGNAPGHEEDIFSNADNVTVYYREGTAGWGATFAGRPTALWNAPPGPGIVPVIKANGSTSDITVAAGSSLSVTVQLDPGQYAGAAVDWWLVARTSQSWFFLDSTFQWSEFDGNLANCRPAHMGALFNLQATEVFPNIPLPAGTYTFWFAVDYPMDGILKLDGQIIMDSVTVTVL